MTIRTDLPRIKPKDKPSYINREMVEDASLINASSFLWVDSDLCNKSFRAIAWGITAIGAIYGGIRGKKRMEMEQREGKFVEDPTYFNHGAGLGAMAGLIGSELVTWKHTEPTSSSLRQWLSITAVGTVIGSIINRRQMAEEFKEAVALKKQMETVSHHPPLQTAQSTSHTAIQIQAATADDQGTLAPAKAQQIAS